MTIIDPFIARRVEELKARLPIAHVEGRPFYVAEGDLLLEEAELADYVPHAANVERPNVPAGPGGEGLIGIVENGQLVRWPPGKVLTYCVVRSSFDREDEDDYIAVCDRMHQATREWESACGVSFHHVAELDTVRPERDPSSQIVFTVRRSEVYLSRSARRLYASAFYPNRTDRRSLHLYPAYFTSALEYDEVGVLRHELGHILGFRHEHVRSEAPVLCDDDDEAAGPQATNPIHPHTPEYDTSSVMHYLCGEYGNRRLEITELDRQGAQKVYCMPFGRVCFVT